jgi:uncharacterized iron-regulated membrane protein
VSVSASTFKVHRWLGWLIGIQVLVWVTGGVFFSLVPFQAWVKSGDTVRPPTVVLPAGWADSAAPGLRAAAALGDVAAVATVATPHGPALRVTFTSGREPSLVLADGRAWTSPDEAALRRFAAGLYRGTGTALSVDRLETAPRRLGIVHETAGRTDLWRVSFDDALATRIYLNARSGEFVTARNEAWVWYDFFWRLHIMDYADGEDFNGTLLRMASVAAFGLVVAGAVLATFALRRRWRVLRKARS